MEGHVSEVTLTLGLRDESCEVLADEIQIQQVIVNLLRNALDAMSDQAEGNAHALHIESGLVDDERVFVRVADTGPGFAEGDLRRIFEPFFSTKQKGLGIGLALCRTIVEAHGGGVSARHRPGGGAILEFTLPIAEDIS
jgi:signal transduction histidine kinase